MTLAPNKLKKSEAVLKLVDLSEVPSDTEIAELDSGNEDLRRMTHGTMRLEGDYTIHFPRDAFIQWLEIQRQHDPDFSAAAFYSQRDASDTTDQDILKTSIDGKIWISKPIGKKIACLKGRMLAACCLNNKCVSITIRREAYWIAELQHPPKFANFFSEDHQDITKKLPEDIEKTFSKRQTSPEILELLEKANFTPQAAEPGKSSESGEKEYLFTFRDLCDPIWKFVFPAPPENGLVVISGSTGGGKSTIVRTLISHYLNSDSVANDKRKPHLITIEDPIETEAKDLLSESNLTDQFNAPFDYTPRRIGIDVSSLEQALRDCKRMKPAIVYVGETREPMEWQAVMEFAGSGHLIITTTHAGSVLETAQRIFTALNIATPADRGNASQALLAIIHLKTFEIETASPKRTKIPATIPAFWRYDNGGGIGLVSDGLASILPNLIQSGNSQPLPSSIGRYAITKHIREHIDPKRTDPMWDELELKTIESDLESL